MIYIRVEPLPDKDKYRLVESLVVEGIKVPKGFIWDGASIPRILWEEIGSPFSPKFMAPSMVHDYLYSKGPDSGYTRREADKLFHKFLLFNGVSKPLAKAMYLGVRVGGGSHYG